MRAAMPPTQTRLPIRLDALHAAARVTDPFTFVFVPGFVAEDMRARVCDDFPVIAKAGSYPVDQLSYGPAFGALVAALESPELERAVEAKLGRTLADHPTMVTVRGMGRDRDGSIHTDSETKIVTMLVYCNQRWEHDGGRLRLLRGADDISDYVLEIPPVSGNMVMFERSARSFHGHLPASEPRRVVQLNWMIDRDARDRELARHRRTAWVKRLNPFG
jgi:SM-20-related protein